MSNGIAMVDLCGGNQRTVPRNSIAPEIAQLYAMGLFRADFRRRYPAGEVLSEWDLVGNTSVGTGKSTTDMLLRRIKTDFRNYYSKGKRNRDLLRKGTPASGLREGRSIRADALGIAIQPEQRALVAELMEVTTIDEAADTIIEDLQPKLALLRGPIKKLVDHELTELRSMSTMVPEKLIAYGTPYVIPADLALVPIFLDTASATQEPTIRWICFGPTYRYRPFPLGPLLTGIEPEDAPARGLIVYSYHQASTRVGVPKEILVRFREWARARTRAYERLELLPTPEITRYWKDNNDDLKLILGYVAAVGVAIAVVVAAIYLAPVVVGAASAALAQLAAVASVEALTLQSAAIIGAISASVPQILSFARTFVTSATTLGPQRFAPGF